MRAIWIEELTPRVADALLPHVNPHVNGLMGGAVGSAGNLGKWRVDEHYTSDIDVIESGRWCHFQHRVSLHLFLDDDLDCGNNEVSNRSSACASCSI